MNKRVIIPESISEKFSKFLREKKLLVFAAPCGFGKTTLVKTLISKTNYKVLGVRAGDYDFEEISASNNWDMLILDDMQLIEDENEYKKLCNFIRKRKDKKFILITRGILPSELIQFKFSDFLMEINENEMCFTKKMTSEYFEQCDVHISETELNSVMKVTKGYPLAVEMYAQNLRAGERCDQALAESIKYKIYLYWAERLFLRLKPQLRELVLKLAPFDTFDIELAKEVSGGDDVVNLLIQLQKVTRMIKTESNGTFYFIGRFWEYLLWEFNGIYNFEQKQLLYERGAMYYERRKDYLKALDFYSKVRDKDKITELLEKIIEMHPGMGYYDALEKYYDLITDEVIEKNPALMQGKSMLASICADYKTSEYWYDRLKEFCEKDTVSKIKIKECRSRLAWLDLSLLQRNTLETTEMIEKVYQLILNDAIEMMPLSVTSTLPSVMNGGKDFSDWSKNDDTLYVKLKKPLECVLGKDGVGIVDCAITESKFEKGEDISNRMLSLASGLNEVQMSGTPDIEFAIVGLIVRNHIALGKIKEARQMLEDFKQRFIENGHTRFMGNIDAMICRVALRQLDRNYVEEWYREKAPKGLFNTRLMKRYQYFVKAMTELAMGKNDDVLLTLSPLKPYCVKGERHIDLIHINVLSAIARYRRDEEIWHDEMSEAIKIAEEYGFVRTICCYGGAVMPLLEKMNKENPTVFLKNVIKASRVQAIYYPDFLRPQSDHIEKLTEAERHVLRLLCADKSNAEIGDILCIQLATVKSHVSHILQKLGVSRRSEAKNVAERLNII